MDSIMDHNFYLDKMWVQCENRSCLKWRMLAHDVAAHVDLNAPWYCYMNTGSKFNKCSDSEEDFPRESQFRKHGLKYAYSKLPLGILVWAKMQMWPRWPGILCPDPVTEQYVTHDLDGNIESHHVEFLGEPHSRCWISIKNIVRYHSSFKAEVCRRKKGWYKSALEEADKLLACSAQQRLEMCYLSKKGMIKDKESKAKMDTVLCRKVIKAWASVCGRKSNYRIRRPKKKRILSSLQKKASEDILLTGNLVFSETECILKDLDQILKQVADSSMPPFKSLMDTEDNRAEEEETNCCMEFIEKRPMESNTPEDCIIIDGKAFKTGECIESIAATFKEIDSLMAEFQDSL